MIYQRDNVFNFLPRPCCNIQKMVVSRTPGFFKLEQTGTELVCLNIITYCVYIENNDLVKGAMKSSNRNLENYNNVPQTNQLIEFCQSRFSTH